MCVDDDEHVGIVGAGDLELAEVTFELDISQGEKELCVIFIKDAAIELHLGAAGRSTGRRP